MPQVILFIATSLDGYIARTDGSVDWLFHDEDYGYASFYDRIGSTLMGKRTFEDILTFGDFPYPDKENYVFTRHAAGRKHPSVTFVEGNIPAFVRGLKKRVEKDIWLVGGGQINTLLLSTGLVDRMIISMHPVVLGQGIPLFGKGLPAETWWTLEQSTAFPSGLVQLDYVFKK